MTQADEGTHSHRPTSIRELGIVFLRLGLTAFGGPAAHIAMMEDQVVRKRTWLTHDAFLDLVGITNLLPGPNSTQMAIQVGYRQAGVKGLILSGVAFILPAAGITLLFAYLYATFGAVPEVGRFMLGIRCAVIAIILGAVVRLGKPFIRKPFGLVIGVLSGILCSLQFNPILILLGSGLVGIVWVNGNRIVRSGTRCIAALPVLAYLLRGSLPPIETEGVSISAIGLFFLKIGSILYGSGYVLVAFLQDGLVQSRHWLTEHQLLDAIAIGQFTPGPVLSTATFIGYLLHGLPGAAVATLCIFLPSFVFVWIVGPFVPMLRRSATMSGFLDAVNPASIGLMLGACVTMGIPLLTSPASWAVFLGAALVQFIWSPNPAWIVAGSALLGWAFSALA